MQKKHGTKERDHVVIKQHVYGKRTCRGDYIRSSFEYNVKCGKALRMFTRYQTFDGFPSSASPRVVARDIAIMWLIRGVASDDGRSRVGEASIAWLGGRSTKLQQRPSLLRLSAGVISS